MDFPIYIDTTSMELSILYLKGFPVKSYLIFMYMYFCPTFFFFIANSADPDEMPHFIWVFTVCQSTCLLVSRMQRICLFDLILYIPSTIFQIYREESSWVERVLS